MKPKIYQIPVQKIDGTQTTLAEYYGKVLLIVNVASKCGLTPQYEGLEKVYERFRDDGFVVLGFPSNDFAGQEPGTHSEIQKFCTTHFGVQFPMFSKIPVKGETKHPLYEHLTETRPRREGGSKGLLERILSLKNIFSKNKNEILWNFEKFVVGRKGEVVARFAPDKVPEDRSIIQVIEQELNKK